MPNLPISQLPQAGILDGTELFAAVQGGITKYTTLSNIKLFNANYGAFSSLQTQSGSADIAYAVKHDTTDLSNGITTSGTGNTRINVSKTGVYTVITSIQFDHNSGGGAPTITSWINIDGSPLANSATDLELKSSVGSKNLYTINYFLSLNAGQYFEIMWGADESDIRLVYIPSRTVPTRPAVPSVITTIQQIA